MYLFFHFWPCQLAWGILVPQPGIEPRPLQWRCWVLTTEPTGNSLCTCSQLFLLGKFIVIKQLRQRYRKKFKEFDIKKSSMILWKGLPRLIPTNKIKKQYTSSFSHILIDSELYEFLNPFQKVLFLWSFNLQFPDYNWHWILRCFHSLKN